jgi:NO-binding membrane sensor protein with MHYT domain
VKETGVRNRILITGVFCGIAIAGMHYCGMAAMRVQGVRTKHNELVVAASILISIVVSEIAMFVLFFLKGNAQRMVVSIIMGFAVCGMHYTGMMAVTYYDDGSTTSVASDTGVWGFYADLLASIIRFVVS